VPEAPVSALRRPERALRALTAWRSTTNRADGSVPPSKVAKVVTCRPGHLGHLDVNEAIKPAEPLRSHLKPLVRRPERPSGPRFGLFRQVPSPTTYL